MKKVIDYIKEYIYDMKLWQVILIVVLLILVPCFVATYVRVTTNYRMINEQRNQEQLRKNTAIDDINVKYKSALQAKDNKDWNKVIAILNTIDMDIVISNEAIFRNEYELSDDKGLKEAILDKKNNKTLFMSEKEKGKYDKLLEIKPITRCQINVLKGFAEGMIEFDKRNYKKADEIFCSMGNVFESDIADDYKTIHEEVRRILAVEMPVKIVDAKCIIEYYKGLEIPHFTVTIENSLDEPVYISVLSARAVEKNGKEAHYGIPLQSWEERDVDLNIPAKSRAQCNFKYSKFFNVNYFILYLSNFYMKNSNKKYTDVEKYPAVKGFKVVADY